jgi:hypothetical protein
MSYSRQREIGRGGVGQRRDRKSRIHVGVSEGYDHRRFGDGHAGVPAKCHLRHRDHWFPDVEAFDAVAELAYPAGYFQAWYKRGLRQAGPICHVTAAQQDVD